LYNNYILLNGNYYINLIYYNWRNNYNLQYFYFFLKNIKLSLISKIKKYIYFFKFIKESNYSFYSMYFFFKKNINIFLKKSLIPFFSFYFKNKYNLNFSFNRKYFLYLYYKRRFNKHFCWKYKKYIYASQKNKFLSVIGHNIYKNLKKKIIFSDIQKICNKKNFNERNFFELNSFLYKPLFKKKKKLKFNPILKKFRYNPRNKKTKKVAFKKFKKSVMFKNKKKQWKKENSINWGQSFSPFIYNKRNSYKNRLKIIELGKKKTPYYFFFKKKNNVYKTNFIRKAIFKRAMGTVPFGLARRCKLYIKMKKNKKKKKIEKI